MTRAFFALLLAVSALGFALAIDNESLSSALSAEISLEHRMHAPGMPLEVHFEITSSHSEPISLLIWDTPLEGMDSPLFRIAHAKTSQQPIYLGRVSKRAQPTAAHFVTIEAHGSLSGNLDIGTFYQFLDNGPHDLRLAFVARTDSQTFAMVESNVERVVVAGTEMDVPILARPSGQDSVGYTGCSSSRTNIVEAAIPRATSASQNALLYMTDNDCRDSFVTWFGTYSISHWNQITTDFNKIHSQFVALNFNINCECDDPFTYAYVYPADRSQTIHLCGAFWNASTSPYEFDSQPGTLTHEMSHFTAVAGTDDIQYGIAGCMELAKNSPNLAVKNADSHEYFQESEPEC